MIHSAPSSNPQLALNLVPRSRWGGRRAGAGRKRGPHPGVPHLRRGRVTAHEPCHVTLRVRRGLPSLRDGRVVREVQRSFARAAEQGTFRVVHFSLQRDHAHLLVEAASPRALGRGMMSIGARIARAVHRAFGLRGPVLEGRYHHRVLRTPREVRNVLVYVLNNVRKHARMRSWTSAIDPASVRALVRRVGPRDTDRNRSAAGGRGQVVAAACGMATSRADRPRGGSCGPPLTRDRPRDQAKSLLSKLPAEASEAS